MNQACVSPPCRHGDYFESSYLLIIGLPRNIFMESGAGECAAISRGLYVDNWPAEKYFYGIGAGRMCRYIPWLVQSVV